jgi:hypothetical protein
VCAGQVGPQVSAVRQQQAVEASHQLAAGAPILPGRSAQQ